MSRLDQIKEMLTKEPDDVFLNFSLAMEYRAAGEADQAVELFDRVLTLDPNYLGAYMRKGETLIQAQRFDEARTSLERGVAAAKECGDEHMAENIAEMIEMLP